MKHDRIFLSFWAIICTFYPTNNPKNQNFEKMTKTLGDIIILHKYTKNPDHTLAVPEIWCMTGVVVTFHLGLIFALLPPNNPKN